MRSATCARDGRRAVDGAMNVFLLAADAILVLHVAFVAFVLIGLLCIVAGGLRSWDWVRNPWFRLVHLGAIAVVVGQSWLGRICPLTTWEMMLRERGGQTTYETTFISYWLQRVLYYDAPMWVFALCYTAFAILVALCWWWVRPHGFQRNRASGVNL